MVQVVVVGTSLSWGLNFALNAQQRNSVGDATVSCAGYVAILRTRLPLN